ncbi:lactate utilization protein, partial [bacterium]
MKMAEWDTVPDDQTIVKTAEAVRGRGISVEIVDYRLQALDRVKEMIPKGASVMTGSSTTLDQIGFTEHLRTSDHGWKDLHTAIREEKNEKKRQEMRRKSVTAEYFLGSVNAISRNGELVACDRTGSRVGAYHYAARNLILVAGAQK